PALLVFQKDGSQPGIDEAAFILRESNAPPVDQAMFAEQRRIVQHTGRQPSVDVQPRSLFPVTQRDWIARLLTVAQFLDRISACRNKVLIPFWIMAPEQRKVRRKGRSVVSVGREQQKWCVKIAECVPDIGYGSVGQEQRIDTAYQNVIPAIVAESQKDGLQISVDPVVDTGAPRVPGKRHGLRGRECKRGRTQSQHGLRLPAHV